MEPHVELEYFENHTDIFNINDTAHNVSDITNKESDADIHNVTIALEENIITMNNWSISSEIYDDLTNTLKLHPYIFYSILLPYEAILCAAFTVVHLTITFFAMDYLTTIAVGFFVYWSHNVQRSQRTK